MMLTKILRASGAAPPPCIDPLVILLSFVWFCSFGLSLTHLEILEIFCGIVYTSWGQNLWKASVKGLNSPQALATPPPKFHAKGGGWGLRLRQPLGWTYSLSSVPQQQLRMVSSHAFPIVQALAAPFLHEICGGSRSLGGVVPTCKTEFPSESLAQMQRIWDRKLRQKPQ